jgi:hypothetical protein
MKPGDLRRFRDNSTTRAYEISGMTFIVVDVDQGPVPAWASILMNGNLKEHWVHDFVLGYSEPVDAS